MKASWLPRCLSGLSRTANPGSAEPYVSRSIFVSRILSLDFNIKPAKQSLTTLTLNCGHSQSSKMARGNQRDKAREANQKKMADQVSISVASEFLVSLGTPIC